MFKPMSWHSYIVAAPDRALEFKLLTLIDQYAVSQDMAEMLRLAGLIDTTVGILARCQRHYRTLQPNQYTALKCKEITRAGYCLTVQPSGLPFPSGEFLYQIYHENNGRNVLTSSWL